MRWHGFASNARHGVSVGLWVCVQSHWRREGAWGTPESAQRPLSAGYARGTFRLNFAPRTRSARCDRTGAITTPRFRVSVPEGAPGRSANVEAADCQRRCASVGIRFLKTAGESAADHDGGIARRRSANVEVRMSKCESARRHCECRFPITMGESARLCVPANPPGEVSRPIAMRESARRMSKCARLCGVANPPGSHRARKNCKSRNRHLVCRRRWRSRWPELANFSVSGGVASVLSFLRGGVRAL